MVDRNMVLNVDGGRIDGGVWWWKEGKAGENVSLAVRSLAPILKVVLGQGDRPTDHQ